jgi:biotin carboxyl carrier protein
MKQLRITVEGKTYDVSVEITDDGTTQVSTPVPVSAPAPVVAAPAAAPTPVAAPPVASAAEGDVTSPLAGVVQAIEAAVGASVTEGQLVITLEAMKMYTSINAPGAGTITAIHCKVGDAVDEGQPLYTLG